MKERYETFPMSAEEMMRHMDHKFPDQCARKGDTIEDIWMAAGARKVYEYFKALQDEANPEF